MNYLLADASFFIRLTVQSTVITLLLFESFICKLKYLYLDFSPKINKCAMKHFLFFL